MQKKELQGQITELEDRHRRNNLHLMNIKEQVGAGNESWEETETIAEDCLKKKLEVRSENVSSVDRTGLKRKKGIGKTIRKLVNDKGCEMVLSRWRKGGRVWGEQIFTIKYFSEYTFEKKNCLKW